MNSGKYVFSQIASFLSANDFNKFVDQYKGNYKVLHFTCWHQLMCMMFGQLEFSTKGIFEKCFGIFQVLQI